MEKRLTVPIVCLLVLFGVFSAGCETKFWDPAQIGRFRPTPAVNVILDSLGVAEETPLAWKGAEEPKPVDLVVFESDYVFSPGDVVRISIFELLQGGTAVVNEYVVTETGKISIPEVGVVEAQGLTESQLEEELKEILSPSVLKEPSITVTLISSQKRTFSILGDGVPGPGRYRIPRYDFRLTDALATAGGIKQFNVSYIYVSRNVTAREAMEGPGASLSGMRQSPEFGQENGWGGERLELISPAVLRDEPDTASELPAANVVNEQNNRENAEGITSESEGREEAQKGRIEWKFEGGRWIPVAKGRPGPAKPEVSGEEGLEPPEERMVEGFEWEQIGVGDKARRVIEIPADRLLGGDPQYNIVVRPGDSIHVPVDVIGEFCIMGNVNKQGYVNLTGRPMTLKMAIASAGGLGPLAWPKRVEVVRRIGRNKEEMVMVDLEKIANGEQPDFFIKPNDLINVGTHATSRWRAILRNAFRATYGFGFLYDRNFAYDKDYYKGWGG